MDTEQNFKIKKDGTKIVDPDTHLKEKIGGDISKIITEENVEAAKEVIEEAGKHFPEEMRQELEKLSAIFSEFSNEEFDENRSKKDSDNFNSIYTIALLIKSHSGMHNYDLATNIARSLVDYCDRYQCTTALGKKIINIHINSLKIIYRQDIQGDGNVVGKKLIAELRELISQDQLL